jgi:hypothetical protein
MNTDEFRNVETALVRMKRRFRNKEITKQEFIESLKKLRVRDDQGRFWMIGVQTGQWYVFDGRKWTPSHPPSAGEGKAICIHCGLENDLDVEACERCGGLVDGADDEDRSESFSDTDGLLENLGRVTGEGDFAEEESVRVLKSVHSTSLALVAGTAGAFFGLLAGVLAGSTTFFPALSSALPEFLKDIQGKLLGGILFAAAGGIAGFAASGVLGWIAAGILNGILSLSGGIKFRTGRTPGE